MKKDDAGIAEFALSEAELASIVGGVQVVTATKKGDDGSSAQQNVPTAKLEAFKKRQEERGTLSQWTFSKPFEYTRS